MSEFYVYDGAARVGILEHWSSVQWLEQYASGGEAKIVAMATPENVALLAVGRALYNPETGTAAHILSQQIDDKGTSPTITLRGAVGAARLDQRVVMGTVAVKDAETGMRAMVSQNLRGLPIQLAAPAGTGVTLDTQVSWGSVLEGLETLASASGLGFGCTFNPETGTETFAVYAGRDRTQGEGYNGYFGDDISNISDLKLVRGVNDHYNVAVVCGQGEGAARVVVLVGSGEGTARRELYVDAKDIAAEYQTATDTGRKDEAGNPIYEYATVQYTEAEYKALLTARGLQKLAEHGATLTLDATAQDGSTLTYGKDYGLGDILPIKLTRYGLLAAARVTGVKIVYEAKGRQVLPQLADFQVTAQAAALNETR